MCGAWSRKLSSLGYVIAILSPFVGSVVYGALPPAMGACLRHLAGRRIDRAVGGTRRRPTAA